MYMRTCKFYFLHYFQCYNTMLYRITVLCNMINYSMISPWCFMS